MQSQTIPDVVVATVKATSDSNRVRLECPDYEVDDQSLTPQPAARPEFVRTHEVQRRLYRAQVPRSCRGKRCIPRATAATDRRTQNDPPETQIRASRPPRVLQRSTRHGPI